jgi:hypothetical protein
VNPSQPCVSRRSNCNMLPSNLRPYGLEYRMAEKMRKYFWDCLLPLGLCVSLTFGELLPAALAQNATPRIDIIVVEGEGATINAHQRASKDPVVRVEDDDHQPMPNVVVVFTLPLSGASGEFANGSKTLTVVTDKAGVAAARGIKANDVAGNLQIYVTASSHGLRARGLINMVVEAPLGSKPASASSQTSKSSGKLKWILLGILAAGGAGAGAYYLSSRSSNSSVSVSAGTVVFGSPR